ncbi:MAG: hypothetical protein NTX13_01120 [Acidobacteria bacterium]|nr:hypothetical protein [Acidobacteriota bacterium]
MRRWLTVASLTLALAAGQDLRVRSEFQRPGPDGEVVPVDKTERPREILSPAVARNAYASYFLTVSLPAGVDWYLEVGQNPENAVRAVLYQTVPDAAGVPDELTKVEMPVKGRTERPEVRSYWRDLWVESGAPVRRIKVEPQVWVGDRWLVYPMEVRVQWATVPAVTQKFWGLPASTLRADAGVVNPWRDALCRPLPAQTQPEKTTVRLLQHRNVLQDVALAKKMGAAAAGALQAGGISLTNEAWCAAPVEGWQKDLAPEWYLRVRDFLYRNAVN